MFIGRTDVEAETPIVWPPDEKSWLIGKDPDAGKDWGQEEKGTAEDEMVGWHHWPNWLEFEQGLGVGDGQGGLACCRPWSLKVSDMTELLNWTELKERDWSVLPLPPSQALLQTQDFRNKAWIALVIFFFYIVAFWTVNCHSLKGRWCQEGKLGQITGKIWVRRSRELPSLKDTNNRVISAAVILVSSLRPVPSLFGAFPPLSSCISLVDFLRSQERAHYCSLVPDWGELTLRCWILWAGSVAMTDSC